MNPAECQEPQRQMDPNLLRLLQRAACVAELCPGVTHKLNNALAGTLSNLELIAMDKNLAPEILESHKWGQEAAWQAADLNRLFVEFITRNDSIADSVDVDGLLFQTVQFLRRFSDRRVDITHTPAPQRIGSRVNPTMLAEAVVTLALLGQRLLAGGGSICFCASLEANRALIMMTMAPNHSNPTAVQADAPALLEWLVHSLVQSVGGSLQINRKDERIAGFLVQLAGPD